MELAIGILQYVVYPFATFYMIAATLLFLICFCDTGFFWSRKKAILLIAFTFVDMFIQALTNENYFVLLIIQLLYNVIAVYDCKEKHIRRFLLFFFAYFINSNIISTVATIGMYCLLPEPEYIEENMLLTDGENLFLTVIVTLTCAFIYHYLYHRLYRKRIFIPCTKREWLFMFGYLLFITALLILIMISEKNGAATFVVMTISVMLLTIIIPLFVFYNKIHNYYRERVEFQETYLQAELAHFQQYKRAQEETRRFRHDIRNNLLCLNEMLHDGRTDEATNYLQELLEGVQSLSSRYVSGDEVLDCILSAKTGEMQQKQITFHLNGILAGGLPWKPIDICNVFANALDNAIEACDKLEDEKCTITMTLKATPQYWFVRIENPVAQDVDVNQIFQERGGYTSKPNAAQHGLGTYNIKRTVESYDGIVKAECKDQWFALELMIDKSCTA